MEERLTPAEYAERGWDLHRRYVEGVRDGSVVHNEWIRLAVERYERDLGRDDLEFNRGKVDRVFKFFSLINIKKGRQFPLLPFQAFILVNLFGLYWRGTESRKYNYFFLFVARKSGKTEFASALQLFFMLGEGVESPESLLLASTTKQAKIALGAIQRMIINSPAIARHLKFPKRGYDIFFKDRRKTGYVSVFVPDADKLDGYSPSSAILDEIHTYGDSSLFDIISQGILARENPLVLLISTAGFEKDSFCNDLVEHGKEILRGNQEDDSYFFMLYMLDEADDPEDKSCWPKANPALGDISSHRMMEDNFKKAKISPSTYNSFLTKNLNIFTQSHSEWIESRVLSQAFGRVDPADLEGRECYGGLDLSSTQDLTSFVLFFPGEEGNHAAVPFFFLADNKKTRNSKYAHLYDRWERAGHLTRCETPTIDHDLVAAKIGELSRRYNLLGIGYDQWNIQLIEKQIKELGFRKKEDVAAGEEPSLVSVKQNHGSMNSPMKFLEALLFDGGLDFPDNPVMRWNLDNVVVQQERTYGNIKPIKNANRDPIDGVIGLLNATAVYLWFGQQDEDSLLDVWREWAK